MKLKKIVISGFKSFADRTELKFGAGMTGIVGPNGCGKSNISDAVRWVLGEQSAKSLRGHKMQDVIFSGTETRKSLGMAEVTLIFSEASHLLPVEFEEIAITRRLYRDGESEYLLNKRQVRLKDIQDLLLGSGIGKDAFAILEQGKMDGIIQSTPEQRRGPFEEAAGITRFLLRRKEALKKLEQSENNLARIKDQHQQALKQAELLQRQAEEAKRFNEQKEELEFLELSILKKRIANAQQQIETLNKQYADWKEEHDYLETNDNERSGKISQVKQALANLEKTYLAETEHTYRLKSEIEGKQKDLKTLSEEAQRSSTRLTRLAGIRQECQKAIEEIKQKKKEIAVKLKEALEQIEQLKIQLEEHQKAASELELSVEEKRHKQKSAHQELLDIQQKRQQAHIDLKKMQLSQESMASRAKEIERKKGLLRKRLEEVEQSQSQKKLEWIDQEKILDQKRTKLNQTNTQLEEIDQEFSKLKKQLDGEMHELSQLKARYTVLNRLKEEMEGYSAGAKRLLKESKTTSSPLFEKIALLTEKLSRGDEEDTLAYESLARLYGQTLVVNSLEDFHQVLKFAEKQGLKDFSLLCLPLILEAKSKKQLAQSTSFEESLRQHFVGSVIVVDSLEQALDASLKEANRPVLIRKGMLIDEKKVLFTGLSSQTNTFRREAEIKSLSKQIEETQSKVDTLQDTLKQTERQRQEIVQQRAQLDIEVRKYDMKLLEFNMGLQRFQRDKEECEKEIQLLAKEEETLSKSVIGAEQDAEQLKLKEEQFLLAAQQAELNWKNVEAETAEVMKHLQQSLLAKQKVQEAYHVQMQIHFQAEQAQKMLEEKEKEHEARIEDTYREEKSHQDGSHRFDKEKLALQNGIVELQKALQKKESVCLKAKEEVLERQKLLESLEQEIQVDRQQKEKAVAILAKLESDLTVKKSALEETERQFTEKMSQVGEEERELNLDESKPLDQMEARAKEIRKKLQQLEGINFAALEEYQGVREREVFLNNQLVDLDKARQEVLVIVNDLDKMSRKSFKETFEQVRNNFKRNFNILFNGGEADLVFTDSPDILEAGIDIAARPPGKEMRLIQLMSGGEKCLTALALLFAFFEVKPSPFCILDEVDAPLDETNVERFGQIIKRFTDRCQFIVITHNKRTMTIADTLFGVSMEEKGVTKVLTLDFDEISDEPQDQEATEIASS